MLAFRIMTSLSLGLLSALGGTTAAVALEPPSPVGAELLLTRVEAELLTPLAAVTVTQRGDVLTAVTSSPGSSAPRLDVLRWRAGGGVAPAVAVSERVAVLQGPAGAPDIASNADGSYVVTWVGPRDEFPTTGIFARLYDSEDRPLTPAFLASGSGPRNRWAPRVAMYGDGSFVVGWTAATDDLGASVGLFARRFTATGGALGGTVQINAPGRDLSELGEDRILGDLELQPDGILVAVWESYEGEGDLYEIFLRRFNADLVAVDPDNLLVNTDEDFRLTRQSEPALAMNEHGDFLVVFSSVGQDGSDSGVFVRRYLADGSDLGPEVPINEVSDLSQDGPDAVLFEDGSFLVVWQDQCGLALGCDPQTPVGNDGSAVGVFGRAFDADGLPQTGDFVVPTRRDGVELRPRIAAGGGVVAAVWTSLQDTESHVAARRLAAPCTDRATALCLFDGRFDLSAAWSHRGKAGRAVVTRSQETWGALAFFDAGADDLTVKMLDAHTVNGSFWLFVGSQSDVAWRLRALDTTTGLVRLYENPTSRFASFSDVNAFATTSGDATIPPPASPTVRSCPNSETRHCLLGGRIEVEVTWQDGRGGSGRGKVLPASASTAPFWFFSPTTPEVVVKVLDGRNVNGSFWVFVASLSDVQFAVTVRDTATGLERVYDNPLGTLASFGDVEAITP